MATRSVAVTPESTGNQPVYLGGYGLGNGQGPGGFTYDDGRTAIGNLDGGPSVRATVISAGSDSVALADIENQGCFAQNKQGFGLVSMRKLVQARTNGALKADQVDVQCDHSHGGPDLIGAWGGVPTKYLEFVQNQTVDAIVDAFNHRRSADLYYGTAESGVEGRTGGPPEDQDPLLTNQMGNDPTGENDVMDSELRVLQARDPGTGAPIATILNLNAHPTVLGSSNRMATGDWPQLANKLMTQDAATFGSQAMTIVGTLGRQQPARGDCPDQALAAKGDSDPAEAICKLTQYSQRVLAREKVALDPTRLHRVGGKPVVVAKTYFIQDPADNVGILALNDVGDLIGAPIMRSNTPPWRTATVVGTVTGSVRIGDVLISSMPGEAYPQIPLAVRDGVGGSGLKGFMTAGLSNDQLGYIIAPLPESYPYVLVRGAQGNDNILFNISQTLGERLTCSLLRGAGEVTGHGTAYWQTDSKCAAFANDVVQPEGADIR
ncbi:MAG: hypothetical protein ACJ76Z_02165 [Thermoleophilaceae bacterium]